MSSTSGESRPGPARRKWAKARNCDASYRSCASWAGGLAGRARISVDTRKRAVAEAALDAGASILNDVSASLWAVAAEAGAGWVVMHMRGEPSNMRLVCELRRRRRGGQVVPCRAGGEGQGGRRR